MSEEKNVPRLPLLLIDEVIEVLRLSEEDGLTFRALSLHLYNRHQGLFGDGPSLRSVVSSLRQVLRSNKSFFSLSDNGIYKLRQDIPQQLLIDFSEENCPNGQKATNCPEQQSDQAELLQMEIDFFDFDNEYYTEQPIEDMVAESEIQYTNGDKQLVLVFD